MVIESTNGLWWIRPRVGGSKAANFGLGCQGCQ
jgi:hypothetical protein